MRLTTLALTLALWCACPAMAKSAAPPPDRVDEIDYQRMQCAMWKDRAAQLELEAAQRRLLAAQTAATETRAQLEKLQGEMNKHYSLTRADHVDDAAPHKITRAK